MPERKQFAFERQRKRSERKGVAKKRVGFVLQTSLDGPKSIELNRCKAQLSIDVAKFAY